MYKLSMCNTCIGGCVFAQKHSQSHSRHLPINRPSHDTAHAHKRLNIIGSAIATNVALFFLRLELIDRQNRYEPINLLPLRKLVTIQGFGSGLIFP